VVRVGLVGWRERLGEESKGIDYWMIWTMIWMLWRIIIVWIGLGMTED
jgi:hypothetical protein